MADKDDDLVEDEVEDHDDEAGQDEGTDASADDRKGRGRPDQDAAKIRRSTAAQTRRKLLEEAGVETVDELKALVTEAKTRRDNDLTETERERQALVSEREATARERAELRERRVTFALKEALRSEREGEAPIRGDRVEDAVEFFVRGILADEGDTEDEAIADAVSEARERWPEWFSESGSGDEEDRRPRVPSTPRRSSTERGSPKKDDPKARARKGYDRLRSGRRMPGQSTNP